MSKDYILHVYIDTHSLFFLSKGQGESVSAKDFDLSNFIGFSFTCLSDFKVSVKFIEDHF